MLKAKNLIVALGFSFVFSSIAFGASVQEKVKLKDLISACKDIATSTSSRWVNPKIAG